MMAGGGVGDRKRGKAVTAEDSRNFTEERVKKKKIALPDLPSFGMHPIYPVRVLACVCVCAWHAGRKAFSI